MFRISSLALLILVLVVPSVPAQAPPPEPRYFLIKLDLSQFVFANKDVRFNKVAVPPEWLYGFFEYMDRKPDDAPVDPKGNPTPWLYKLPGEKESSLFLRKHKWGTEALITPVFEEKGKEKIKEKSKAIQWEIAENKTPLKQYLEKKKKAGKNNLNDLIRLARLALMYELPEEFDEAMGLIKNKNAKIPAVYADLKALLDKRAFREAPLHAYLDNEVRGGYNNLQNQKGHFVVYYNNKIPQFAAPGFNVPNPGLVRRLVRMEQTMSNFFIWFALQENIPEDLRPKVPGYRLPVLLEPPKVFDKRLKDWGPPRGHTSGFTIRSDNFVVLCSSPNSDMFQKLEVNLQPVLQRMGFTPEELITGVSKGKSIWLRADVKGKIEAKVSLVQTLALLQKAFEDDVETSTISRECTRQLLGATGLLAPNVAAPEWVQSGLVSFFEIPPHSLYPNFGQLRGPLLDRFKSMQMRDKKIKDVDILINLIDDRYFRDANNEFQQLKKLEKKGAKEDQRKQLRDKIQDSLDTGEATSWAFVYYLSRTQKMPMLLHYMALLNDLPRHTLPNAQTLEACFAQAFDMKDPANPRLLDLPKLETFAKAWIDAMKDEISGEMKNVEAFMNEGGK